MAGIIVGGEARGSQPVRDTSHAWRLVRLVSVVFVAVSVVDLGLALVPADLSTAPARFAAMSGAVGGLPILVTGTIGLLMAGIALASRTTVLAGTVFNLLQVVFTVILIAGFAPSYGEALAAVPEPVRRTVTDALARGLVFGGGFLTAGLGAVAVGFRELRGV